MSSAGKSKSDAPPARATTATLTEGPVGRTLARLTVPMIMGHFAMVAFNLTDTYFVGQLGTEELAALSFTFPVIMFIFSIVFGVGMGTGSVVARAIGEGDSHKVRRLTTDSLLFAFLFTATLALLGFLTMETVFGLMGAKGRVMELIRQYMYIWYGFAAFAVIPMVGNNAIRATGDTKLPGMIMSLSAVLNIIFDPLLIMGWGPFPKLGVQGAALATMLSRAISFCASLYLLYKRDRLITFERPKLHEVLSSWKEMLFVGIPAGLTNLLMPVSMSILTGLVAFYGGNGGVAAFGSTDRIKMLAGMVPMALASVTLPFVGQNWGAGRRDRVLDAHVKGSIFSLAWGLASAVIIFPTSYAIAGVFSDDSMVISYFVLFLGILPLGYGFENILRISTFCLNGIRKPFMSSALIAFSLFGLFLPLSWLGSKIYGITGIACGMMTAMVIGGVVTFFAVRRMLRNEVERLEAGKVSVKSTPAEDYEETEPAPVFD